MTDKKINILFNTPLIRQRNLAGGPYLRIENSIKALSKITNLHLLLNKHGEKNLEKSAVEFYSKFCEKINYKPSIKIGEFLGNYIKEHDIKLLWFGYGNISYGLMKAVRESLPDIKIVCDTDSVWSRFILRELPYIKDPAKIEEIKIAGLQKEEEEKKWVEMADVTTAVSEIDADYYRSYTINKNKIKIFSNAIDVEYYKSNVKKPYGFRNPNLYLAGSFFQKDCPMELGARFIIDQVLPKVRKKYNNIHFYILGMGADKLLSDINDENITITGYTDSVLPYLKNSDIVLVPLFYESGTRFKILEAGVCGKPIVSTTLGAEGLNVKDKENILIADSPEDFAEAIITLLEDKKLKSKISLNCKKLILNNYSLNALIREGQEIIDYLLKNK